MGEQPPTLGQGFDAVAAVPGIEGLQPHPVLTPASSQTPA